MRERSVIDLLPQSEEYHREQLVRRPPQIDGHHEELRPSEQESSSIPRRLSRLGIPG
jgi:hypothetical protein